MKLFFLLALLLFSFDAVKSASLDNLYCKTMGKFYIRHQDLGVSNFLYTEMYHFKNGNLFTTSSHNPKPRIYNKYKESEPLRVTSGHKVIIFQNDYKNGIVVHTDSVETYLIKLECEN